MSTATEDYYAPLERTVEIDAPPAQVWKVVSDLKRMGEWSPQCRKVVVLGGGIKHGTRMLNLNRDGLAWWPTNTKVVRYQPERAIAFRVAENKSIWVFELDPLDDGSRTKVTQRRLMPDGSSALSTFLVDKAFGGKEKFRASLGRGMDQTLERIKSAVER